MDKKIILTKYKLTKFICYNLPPIISARLRAFLFSLESSRELGKQKFKIRSKTGSFFSWYFNDFHAYPFSIHGYYDWRNIAIARAVCSDGFEIVEVGANIGTETLGFADIVSRLGKVHAFEPIQDNISCIKENLRENKIDHVDIYPYAVGVREEKLKFTLPPSDMSGMGHLFREGEISENLVEVMCYPLDKFLPKFKNVKALFIDVEGADLMVIQGARNLIMKFQPIIVLEVNENYLKKYGQNKGDLLDELESLSYDYFSISRLGIKPISINDKRSNNWICIPKNNQGIVKKISKTIFLSAVLPFIGKINPLTR